MKFKTSSMRELLDAIEEFEETIGKVGNLVGAAIDVEIDDHRVRVLFDGIVWELKDSDA